MLEPAVPSKSARSWNFRANEYASRELVRELRTREIASPIQQVGNLL
jgi:hypothetical protein